MAISTQYGQDPNFFGGEDYLAAKAQGISDTEIFNYLQNNMGKIRGGNLPGGYFTEGKFLGPGVYERAKQGAQVEKSQQDLRRVQQETRDAQKAFEERIAQQQSQFQSQLMAQQQKAQDAQRQLMISLQRTDRAPAAVKTASSGAERSGLTRRGTTGYFGRRGMRIGSLNVPTSGLAIAPNMNQSAMAGSFA